MSRDRSNRPPSGGRGAPRSTRPSTRDAGRSGPRGDRPDWKNGGKGGSGGNGGRPSGRSGGGGRSGGSRTGSRGDKFTPKWREERDDVPLTDAQRRAAEVDARRGGPRPPRDPDLDRRHAEERSTEEWIDEGSVRDAALAATGRATAPRTGAAKLRRAPRPLDPEIGDELVDALGDQRGKRLSERLAQASEALDRERFDEARRISASIAKEAPLVAAVQEVLGLSSYRLGRYKQAVAALQAAQELHGNPALLPVIADGYRAMRRWSAVERVWGEIKAASPPHEVIAEGRIVMANALADQNDLRGAIDTMHDATKLPKRVRDHHLRQWYVLGDFYDRLGDTIAARRWFATVADHDPDFVDVLDRLRTLGR